jgi:hypothetical protein
MTVPFHWPRDVVNRLTEDASKHGLSLDAYLLQIVLRQQRSNGVPMDDVEGLSKREQAAARIRELRKGNILGPNLTIRDLIEEGRRF